MVSVLRALLPLLLPLAALAGQTDETARQVAEAAQRLLDKDAGARAEAAYALARLGPAPDVGRSRGQPVRRRSSERTHSKVPSETKRRPREGRGPRGAPSLDSHGR